MKKKSPHKVKIYCIYCIQNLLFLCVHLDQAHTCNLYYFIFINNKYNILSIKYEGFFKKKDLRYTVIQLYKKTLL